MPRQFAFFLPQFHTIPENDKWWGEGFTEWVNVKKAKPLFKGHSQPKIPLNKNYYDLLDRSTVEWQTALMKKHHVDGMIYYHYYFKGKLLLEKPAENLLKWKDIDQPFFFCWANHSWYRSWEGSKELLIAIEYGLESDWEKHFQYLLPFFKDNRYEKKDGKPLFMVFENEFSEKNKMFEYFDRRCKECGFNGICIIETRKSKHVLEDIDTYWKRVSPYSEFVFEREPNFSNLKYMYLIKNKPERIFRIIKRQGRKILGWKKPEIFDGDKLYSIKNQTDFLDPRIIHGTFFEWDNTSRHGSRGYIITPVSKSKYFMYMNKIKDDQYVFINAWNEWCEGMMLEPTEECGYKYLEWIKEWTEKQKV